MSIEIDPEIKKRVKERHEQSKVERESKDRSYIVAEILQIQPEEN